MSEVLHKILIYSGEEELGSVVGTPFAPSLLLIHYVDALYLLVNRRMGARYVYVSSSAALEHR